VMNVHNSRQIKLNNIVFNPSPVLLHVSGEKSTGIALTGTDARKAGKEVELSFGAKEGSVTVN
jgi:hypothetical protein